LSGLPPAPPTSIQTVFAQVDQIAAGIQTLAARSPTYAQFSVTLVQLSRQIGALQDQIAGVQDQFAGVFILLQAILDALAPLTTAINNQDLILAVLKNIQNLLMRVPGVPTEIGIDLKSVATERQPTPTERGP
jgi:ABC-type transporter Mla subunit MlaD